MSRDKGCSAIFNFPAAPFQIQVHGEQFRSSRVVALRCSKYRIKVLMKHNCKGVVEGGCRYRCTYLPRTYTCGTPPFPGAIQRNDYYGRKRRRGAEGRSSRVHAEDDVYYQRLAVYLHLFQDDLQLRPSLLSLPLRTRAARVLMATTFVAANESKWR